MGNLGFQAVTISILILCVHSNHLHSSLHQGRVEDEASSEMRIKENSDFKDDLVVEGSNEEVYLIKNNANTGFHTTAANSPENTIPCIQLPPKPTKAHLHFVEDLLSHITYITLAQKNWLDSIATSFIQKNWSSSVARSACLRVLWKAGDKRFSGFGKTIRGICPHDNVLKSQCYSVVDHEKRPYSFTTVWTDGEHHALVVGCSYDGGASWKVLSNTKTITKRAKNRVLAELEKHNLIGVDDAIELPHEHCSEELDEEVSDGRCDPHLGLKHGSLISQYGNKILKMISKGMYTPISSILAVHGHSKMLIGKVPTQSQASRICRKFVYARGKLVIQGLGNNTVVLRCNTQNIKNMNCVPEDQQSSNNNIFLYTTKVSYVWTDLKRYILGVTCLTNNLKAFVLLSSTKTVDPETEDFIAKKIQDYGFDPDNMYITDYKRC